MLEKKENVLIKKAAAEVEKAKEFTRVKNKRGMLCNWVISSMVKCFLVLIFVPFLSICSHVKCE